VIIVGLDFSKNKCGVVVYTEDKVVDYKIFIRKDVISNKLVKSLSNSEKVIFYNLDNYVDTLSRYLLSLPSDKVIIFEGYSFGSTSRAIEQAEYEGAVKYVLSKNGVKNIISIPVTKIRKALGKGSYDKKDIFKKVPKEIKKEINKLKIFKYDISDAYAVAKAYSVLEKKHEI